MRSCIVLTLALLMTAIVVDSHVQQSLAQFGSGDAFSSRVRIRGASGHSDGSSVGASKESAEPNHAGNSGGASLWWTWTAPATGAVSFDTRGSNFDTLLAVYTGTSLKVLETICSNDDAGVTTQSQVRFTAQGGETYHIAVDGYDNAAGTIVLNWQTPDNEPLSGINGVSTTVDNQIVVELLPGDTAPANLFDLNGRTLIFTPDGEGRYSREVRNLEWERDLGEYVGDGAVIMLESFGFDFAGQRREAFHISRHGLVTFGGPLTYAYWDSENRFSTMRQIANKFVSAPTISPLYKPMLGGRDDNYGATQHVAHWPDRVVVTWVSTEPDYYMHGAPPQKPARFQMVLGADGSVRFSYADVTLGDGIVGLFPDGENVKGDLIARFDYRTNPELPAYLDLREAAVYETNTDAVILEFTLRGRVPNPPDGEWYSYRLHFDVDEPYWTHPVEWSDEDFTWQVDVRPEGERVARGQGVMQLLSSESGDRIALLADIPGSDWTISGTVFAAAAHFRDDSSIRSDNSPMENLELNAGTAPAVDLSQSDNRFTNRHSEVFHYRSPPNTLETACRIIDALGDGYDVFVFHNEFRVDSQESATPVRPHYGNARATGTGIPWNFGVPCGEGRLMAVWRLPVWMSSDHVINYYGDERNPFDRGLLLFAHEFTHVWTAHASFVNSSGEREPLYDDNCQCHWRWDLHLPAAFPWHAEETGPTSLMAQGGTFWRDNGDGTHTSLDGYFGGGHSWLDLYMMGLAGAHEVPDMFILRNLRQISRNTWTGDKEMISINQVIAAEGPREPRAASAQKIFNAGFVYFVEPGQTPSGELLELHGKYMDKVKEHWAHIIGGRSRITTNVGRAE